jgi:hypothetical protein
MNINRVNYEEYLVSSLEGMLSTKEQAVLNAFLYEHPELKKEVDAYKRAFLVPDKTITYPHKSLLLKPEASRAAAPVYKRHFVKINRINYEEYLVSSLEGKLTTEEQVSLDAYLQEHPELKPEVDAYKLAFLVPDKTISYPHKSLLLKSETVRIFTPFYRRYSVWLSVAAAVLVLIIFRIFLHNDFNSPQINTPATLSQSGQQNTIPSNYSLSGQQAQKYFGHSKGNLHTVNAVNKFNPNGQGQSANPQTVAMVKEVSDIPAKNATYIPQQQSRRFAMLQTNSSEQARVVAEHLIAQRKQSALISNAALIGKTLLHLSGRQMPNEINNEAGQQFRVVTVSYDSKDFSFVKIVH